MFNDEESYAISKMQGYCPVDGFVEITECLADIINFVANEPSVGLFYIQEHTQNAVPNLINLNNNIVEKSHEMTLHSEDTQDSIIMMRSMKECGFSITGEMIRDIKNSLAVMSTKQQKGGPTNSSNWRPAMWYHNAGYRQHDGESSSRSSSSGCVSNGFVSAKQKASHVKWPELESTELNQVNNGLYPGSKLSVAATSNSSTKPESEGEELPLSSPVADNPEGEVYIS